MITQVLVATMHQKQGDYTLLDKMNIKSGAIVCNQCDYNSCEEFVWHGQEIRWLSFSERGVGLNRNNALMRATADYCLFADDDMKYNDDYANMVEKAFQELPKADVIIFNIIGRDEKKEIAKKVKRVNCLNYMRYGTARVAIKLSSIRGKAIYFNQCFGGGTEHCHGEDSIFLNACLKNGLSIYAVPNYIAELTNERDSSWNEGYNEKYLRDQGHLYRTISNRWWLLLCLQDSIRRYKSYGMGIVSAYKLMSAASKD